MDYINIKSKLLALTRKGIRFSVEGSSLAVEGNLRNLIDADREFLKGNKTNIVNYLKTLNVSEDTEIPLRESNTPIPLSYSQSRLWFIEQVDQESAQYSMPIVLRVDGVFDINIAESAIKKIVDRHQILRTCYEEVDGEARQIVKDGFNFKFRHALVEGKDEADSHNEIEFLLKEEANRKFNLSSELMIRGLQIEVKPTLGQVYSVVMLNMHHIAADGWSMGILTYEFSKLYQSLVSGEQAELPDLEIQYGDFSVWQRGGKSDRGETDSISYWQKQLENAPVTHAIPLDYPRPNLKQTKGKFYSEAICTSEIDKLEDVAKQHNVTLFMLIHSALALCVSKFSDEDDVVIGTPFANRQNQQLESLIGFFVNTLVLRCSVNHKDFESFINHIKSINLAAQSNQNVPFEKVVEVCNVPRTSSYTPVFQIMLSMNNTQQQSFNIEGVNFSSYPASEITSKYDIELEANLDGGELNLDWIYDASIFSEEKIARISSAMKYLLTAIASGENFELKQAPVLSRDDINYLTNTVNSINDSYIEERSIHECFELQVNKSPKQIAVISGNEELTYQEVNERANLLANQILETGAKPGEFVGISAERSPQMVIAILGILKAGCAYVPLDTKLPKERLDEIIDDTDLKLRVLQKNFLTSFEDDSNNILLDDIAVEAETCDKSQLQNISSERSKSTPQDIAYVVFTSGSTGKPKGIMVEHHSMLARFEGWDEVFGLTQHPPVILQMADFSVDICLGDIVKSLTTGGQLVLCDKESLLSAPKLYKLLDTRSISFGDFVPSVLRMLMDYMESNNLRLNHIKHILVGSESWYGRDLSRLRKLIGTETKCFNIYGQTETVIDVSYNDVTQLDISDEDVIPFGRVLKNTSLYILDRNDDLQPVGAPGEICIGGPGLARGYLNLPSLTKQKFISTNLSQDMPSSLRLYKTGDHAVRQEDGSLKFLGRKDHQIKIRGFRIELSEIEKSITKCKGVKASLVILEEESQKLIAYMICRQITNVEKPSIVKDIKKSLSINLPNYMMPSAFIFIDEWPLNSAGKINRGALPKPDSQQFKEELVAPTSQSELTICQIWSEVLGVSKADIGTNSDFFELGGHSLLLTRVASEIRKEFTVELSMRELFESSLLSDLAEYVSTKAIETKNSKQRFKDATSTKASQTEELVI